MAVKTVERRRAAGKARRNVPSGSNFQSYLGLKAATWPKLLSQVEKGLAYSAFDAFKMSVRLPATDIADALQIPRATLANRRVEGRLSASESERLVRMARLWAAAVDLFDGDVDAALNWMKTSKRALNHVSPWEMVRSEMGAREVEMLIGRLEHGVFS